MIHNEITINYKMKQRQFDMPKITCSKDAEEYFRSIWTDKVEHIEESYIILLNRANKVVGYSKISMGGIAGTVIDSRVVFQTALKANASSIIIAHNHPSGNLKPSDADLTLTKKLKEAGAFLEIPFLDHLILTSDGYLSLADEGLL